MSFFQKHKKLIIVISSIITIIVLAILIIQFIIGNILESKLKESLSKIEDNNYIIDVGNVKVNLFTMTLILKDIDIAPDSLLIQKLKQNTSKLSFGLKLKIPNLRVRNIDVISLVSDKHLDINNFLIKKAEIQVLLSKDKNVTKPKEKGNNKFDIDSIVIPGLNGADINKFTLSDFSINVLNAVNDDTIFYAKSLDITLDDITLTKNEDDSTSLRLNIHDADVIMTTEQFRLPGDKYILSFSRMRYDKEQELLAFNNLKIKPRFSLKKMVKLSEFQYEIFNVEIKSAEINSLDIGEIIKNSDIILSNVVVDSMNLNIFKDKHFPFDTTKRPKLPMQSLKLLKQNLYVDSVIITNSEITYSEMHKKTDIPMVVNLNKVNASISNITSISDSIDHRPLMTVSLLANLQKEIPMGINVYFPMNSVADTFSFNGWMGNGDMKLFNSILLPALGIRFDAGSIDELKFSATANTTYSIGEMTMLYHDLDGVVVRKDMEQTNKFLSWVANTAMIKNNPIPNKEKRTEPMYFNRVMYKGLGNFIWKTLQSGITATIIPTMDNKVQKQVDVKLGTDIKTIRKREREEKRKNRKN